MGAEASAQRPSKRLDASMTVTEFIFDLPHALLSSKLPQQGAPAADEVTLPFVAATDILAEKAAASDAAQKERDLESRSALATGRLGPQAVGLDASSATQHSAITAGGLAIESLQNFSSARANVCVFRGKWMYEVVLGSAGLQQIGWSTLRCPFTVEEGKCLLMDHRVTLKVDLCDCGTIPRH